MDPPSLVTTNIKLTFKAVKCYDNFRMEAFELQKPISQLFSAL